MQSADLSSDYFSLFGLPAGFDIDLQDLTLRYRDLQRAVHPDRFANASQAERRLSVQMAAHINEGFRTLKDPLARGRYLLELRGVEFSDTGIALDNAFLMEQMELREHLDEVKGSGDPLRKITVLYTDIRNRQQELTELLASLLQNQDEASLIKARDCVRKLQFFRRLDEELGDLEAELEDV